MALWDRIFTRRTPRDKMERLYAAIVQKAREKSWYRDCNVPDTMDGRFNMVTAILSLVLLRLENDDQARAESALLAELFIADMDGQMRQIGIGDVIVGKEIGRMMGALGGRMGAFRAALAAFDNGDEAPLASAVQRNILDGVEPDPNAFTRLMQDVKQFRYWLSRTGSGDVLNGQLSDE